MGLILAFGHKKQMGKDTLAKHIIDVLRPKRARLRIVQRGFADKVYEVCHVVYGWAGFKSKAHYDRNPKEKEVVLPLIGKTPRRLLIDIGTPVMRAYDDDVWINCTLRGDFDVLLLTDMRFPNEFETVKKLGGHCIRVLRPSVPPSNDEADCALDGWEDKWTETVINDGGLDKMYAEAERLVDKYITCGGLFT